MPWEQLASILAFVVVLEIVGSASLAKGDKPIGLLAIVCGALFGGFYLLLLLLFISGGPVTAGKPTGRMVARMAPGGAVWSAERRAWTWTGGGSAPGNFWRVNTSVPAISGPASPSPSWPPSRSNVSG